MPNLIKKITSTPKGWSTKPKERLSYYLYFCGQNAIYNLVASFLTTYLMLSIGGLVKTAGIMLAVKVWDAVNDAIFGVLFDKVKFKSGKKFVPWLKISLVFIPLTTVMLFAIPNNFSENAKLIWLAVSYILWDTAYTLCDVPMSENIDERNSIISYKQIWAGVGSGVALILGTVLVGEQVKLNYTVVAIICAVFAIITMIPACFKLEERFGGDRDEDFTIKKMFSYLVQNKYLLIYYIGYFFYSSANVSGSLNLFVSFYLFNNSQFSLVVQALSLVPAAIFSFLVPHMVRKFDKMKLFRVCTLATVILSVVMWLIGYNSMIGFIIISILRAVPMAILGVMLFMFTPDCAVRQIHLRHRGQGNHLRNPDLHVQAHRSRLRRARNVHTRSQVHRLGQRRGSAELRRPPGCHSDRPREGRSVVHLCYVHGDRLRHSLCHLDPLQAHRQGCSDHGGLQQRQNNPRRSRRKTRRKIRQEVEESEEITNEKSGGACASPL